MQLARLCYHKYCGFPVSWSKQPPFTCSPLNQQSRPCKQECKTQGDRAIGLKQVTPTMKRELQDRGEMLTETQKSWITWSLNKGKTTREVLAVSPSGRRPATCPKLMGSHTCCISGWRRGGWVPQKKMLNRGHPQASCPRNCLSQWRWSVISVAHCGWALDVPQVWLRRASFISLNFN